MAVRVTKENIEVAGKLGALPALEPGYLPELVDFFMQNWQAAVSIDVAWSTDVTLAHSQAEERRSLVDRPYRSLAYRWTGMHLDESERMWTALLRHHHQRLLVPLYSDKTKTSAPSAGATLTCEAAYRRFSPGGRALVHDWAEKRPANPEIFTIASVTAGSITATAPLGAHPAGARVMPLIETEVMLDRNARLLSNVHGDFDLRFDEVTGPGGLNPWLPTWDSPPLPTYRQIPILTLRPDWAAGLTPFVRRAGESQQEGRAQTVSKSGDRPRIGFEWTFTGTTRAKAWEILRFVDSRRGRLRNFFVVSPQTLWRAVGITDTTIEIAPVGNLVDLQRFFDWVAITFADGMVMVRGIVDVIDAGMGAWAIHVSEPLPSTRVDIDGVKTVTSAHLSRFDRDGYSEEWTTDERLSVDCRSIEVLRDRSYPIELFSDPIPQASPDAFEDLHLWLESPINMLDVSDVAVTATGQDVARWLDRRVLVARELRSDVPPLAARHAYYAAATLNLRARNAPGGPLVKGELWTEPAEPIFSNALGMTLFVGMQRRTTETHATADDFILTYLNALGTVADGVLWTPTEVRMWEDAGKAEPDFWIQTADILYPRAVPHVICLTWKPGFYTRVYQDGVLRGEAPKAVVDLPIFTGDQGRARFFRFANNNSDPASDDDTWLDSVAIFRRALLLSELNQVGQYMATLVGTTWRKVT